MKFRICRASDASVFDERMPSEIETVMSGRFPIHTIEINTLEELLGITEIDDIIIERNTDCPESLPTYTIIVYDDYIE